MAFLLQTCRRPRLCCWIGLVATWFALVATRPVLAQGENQQDHHESNNVARTEEQRRHWHYKNHNRHGRMRSRASDTSSRKWLQEAFPNPETNAVACGGSLDSTNTSSGRICDPDGILLEPERKLLEQFLMKPHYSHQIDLCPTHAGFGTTTITSSNGESEQNKEETPENKKGLEIQMAVALVRKMDLSPFESGGGDQLEERAVEAFARHVHDDWGVGLITECGGAGVLVFVSVDDHAMYISRGAALEQYLTDNRLDRVMDNMKSLLRVDQYHEAILLALEAIIRLIQQGPPSAREVWMDQMINYGIPLGWISLVAGFIVFSLRKQRKDRQEYASVQSQLNEIDRARAEALQGQYRAESCPICLECFEKNDDKIPIKGSDGQPLKLLRCGHVFDENCWAEWVNSGRSNISKCPICNQDVGSSSIIAAGVSQSNIRDINNNRSNTAVDNDDDDDDINNAMVDNNHTNRNHQEDYQAQRVLRLYQRERNFRLERLGNRYPRYIHPQMVRRWAESTYNGPLVSDPAFVQNDPTRARPGSTEGGSRSRGGGGGFGGGSSGGGRAGRW